MFSIEQIMTARAKIRSGEDFPVFIEEMVKMGVTGFDSFAVDGHSEYHGENGYHLSTRPAYAPMPFSSQTDVAQFEKDLGLYLDGEINYPIFCEQALASGVVKWKVDFAIMTCTYFDSSGNTVFVQAIP